MSEPRASRRTKLGMTHDSHLLNELTCTCHGTKSFTHLLAIGLEVWFRCKIIHILDLKLLSPFKFLHISFVHWILLAMSSGQMVEGSCSYVVTSRMSAVAVLHRALAVRESVVRGHVC